MEQARNNRIPVGSKVTVGTALAELPDRPIASSRDRKHWSITLDVHAPDGDLQLTRGAYDHNLICYCPQGSGVFVQKRCGGRYEGVIRAGTSIIMPAGCESVWEGAVPMSARLRVPNSVLDDALSETHGASRFELVNRFEVRDPIIESIASILMLELGQPSHPAQRLVLDGLSAALAGHLLRSHNAFRPPDVSKPERMTSSAIQAVKDYIESNLEMPLGLAELAAVAGSSRFHFIRLFKRATGMAPAAYVQSARVDWAKRLMLEGDLPLAEIALTIGFADQSHFTRRFRHHTGTTPGEYVRRFGNRR